MDRTFSNPAGVAAPAAHYSHSVRVEMGDSAVIYVSGQVPVDADNQLVGKGDFGAQMQAVYDNISRILEAAGGSMADIVKFTTFVTSFDGFEHANAVRKATFPENAPASSTVRVSQLFDPEWLVEVDAVAVVRGA